MLAKPNPNQFLPVEASVESVEHTTTSDKVFQIIYGWIVVGRYQPGDTLPSQDEMARQLNVSRVTLREALFRLSALGLVRLKHGVGTEVLPVNAANFIATLPGHLLQHPIVLSEFLEARLIAERSSVKLAVKKANEEDLRRIAGTLELQKKALDAHDINQFVKHDVAFHQELVRAGHNSVMLKFLQTIWDLLYNFTYKTIYVPGNMEKGFDFHSAIYQALKERNAVKADAVLCDHIRVAVESTVEFLDQGLDIGAIFGD